MIRVSVSEVKASFSEFVNRAAFGQERVVILSRGKPKAALISADDLALLEELEDAQAAREALAEHERGETIGLTELKAELAGIGSGV